MSTTDNPAATDLLESAQAVSAQSIDAIEASVKRIRELNEQAIKAARAAGLSALDAYRAALESVVDAEEKAIREMRLSESAGINRHGGGNGNALHRRSSDPRWPRVMRWRPARAQRSVDRGTRRPGY